MLYQTIRYRVADGVATITLNRPDVMNSLTTQMRAEIEHAAKAAGKEARVLVITGKGKAFCAGQDLGDRKDVAHIDLEDTLKNEYEPMLRAIIDCPVPTIAAVNGAAAGAGANIALAADIVIASEAAYFLQAFSRIGLIPDAGGTYWMVKNVGMARAMGMALMAEKLPARRAADWGLIWEAVPEAEFDAHWRAKAAALAAGPTEGYRLAKKAIRAAAQQDLDAQFATEAHLQGRAGKTRDFREGVMAFLEKRAATFEGR